jgi:hypothetical protein
MTRTRILRKSLAASALIGLLVGGGYLYAQPTPPDDDADDVTVPMEKKAELSPIEMTTATKEIQGKMETMLQRVLTLRESARKQKDVLKLNCVNEKLLQVKQLLNIADEAETELATAIAASDNDERYHQFGRINISYEKVASLRDEAEGCIGEDLIYFGETQVDVVGPHMPDDPYEDPFGPGIEYPGYRSPFY